MLTIEQFVHGVLQIRLERFAKHYSGDSVSGDEGIKMKSAG